MEEWLVDSNEALTLNLVRAEQDPPLEESSFNPEFTYPIFGDKEKIFGYKGLDIQLSFASGSLKQLLQISYNEKLSSTATPPDDIEKTLYEFIPSDYTKSAEDFQRTVDQDATAFRPPGENIRSYVRQGEVSGKGKGKGKVANGSSVSEDDEGAVVFEMYKADWSTPGFREYHRRMQLFVLLYIEGGSYIQEDEDSWEFITLFERRLRPSTEPNSPMVYTYHFAGYISAYPFWCYPDQVRLRLSQFVILPPYQHKGHGAALYNCLYQHALERADVAELTVEDPSEAFEDLRDRNDLRQLTRVGIVNDPGFKLNVGTGDRKARSRWEEDKRRENKMASRQFLRLIEMLLLKGLDREDKMALRAWRLQVKARLFRFNYEILSTMTPDERREGLSKTFDTVLEDYDRILAMTFGDSA